MINEFLFSAVLYVLLAISVAGGLYEWIGLSSVTAILFLMGLFITFHTMAIYMLRGGSVLRLILNRVTLKAWKHMPHRR